MGLVNGYGLDSNSLSAPFSLLASILMILGLSQIGLMIERAFSCFGGGKASASLNKIGIYPIFGVCLLSPILYPIILFGNKAREVLFYCALFLCIAGLNFGLTLIKLYRSSTKSAPRKKWRSYIDLMAHGWGSSKTLYLTLFLILGYGLLAASPPTDADDLAYHTGVALEILNHGSWIFAPEWFHSRLAGLGEILIALGLSIGAQQFGQLLQYCGLICIYSLLLTSFNKEKGRKYALLALIFLSSPVLLSLIHISEPTRPY